MQTAEKYKKYVEKVGLVNQQRKRRPLPIARGLQHFLTHFNTFAEVLQLKGISKPHVVGLSASMGNLKKSESALGLFSDPFIDTAEKLAKEIVGMTKKNAPQGTVQIVQMWLELSVLTIVGILELARERKVKEDVPIDPFFRDELLLTLLFYTDYPKRVFQQMAEALEIEKSVLFIGLFQVLSLIFALIAYSDEEGIRTEFGEALSVKLLETIQHLIEGIPEENEIQSHLKLAEMALEKGEIDQLSHTIQDMMDEAGYSKSLLAKDISAMKDLFKRLKTAYFSAHEKSTNMVHVIG